MALCRDTIKAKLNDDEIKASVTDNVVLTRAIDNNILLQGVSEIFAANRVNQIKASLQDNHILSCEPTLAFLPLEFIAFSIASTPADSVAETSGDSDLDKIIIPIPVGTVEGDLMIVNLSTVGAANEIEANPAGWTTHREVTGLAPPFPPFKRLASKIATASEPADYTWGIGGNPSTSRSGSMVTIRNAAPLTIFGFWFLQANDAEPIPIPNATNNKEGSMLIGMLAGVGTGLGATNDLTPNSPLDSEHAEHSMVGSEAYSLLHIGGIVKQENVPLGLITGRTVSSTDGFRIFTLALLVQDLS